MLKIIKREEGNVLVIIAFAMLVIMGFSAVGIDMGVMLTARNQLQSAVDAAALGGASGLIVSQAEATSRAITFAGLNTCINEPVTITAADVTFPTASRVMVQATRVLNLFFARVLGINSTNITVSAVAGLGILTGTGDLKPFAIPDLNYPLGVQVILKAGALGAPGTSAGFFYPVDFPPINRGTPITGAQAYNYNIINGSDGPIYIGDELLVEPGNMIGPTIHAIDYLMSLDPNASWNGTQVVASVYPGSSSPRIFKIPFYDPNFPPDSGRNTVIVIRLGAFFLEGTQGRDVIGRFISITTSGSWGGGPSSLMGVKLVE